MKTRSFEKIPDGIIDKLYANRIGNLINYSKEKIDKLYDMVLVGDIVYHHDNDNALLKINDCLRMPFKMVLKIVDAAIINGKIVKNRYGARE